MSYFATTSGWPAIGKCAKSWFPDERQFGAAWAVLCTSSRVAAVSSSVLLGLLLRWRSWRAVLRCAMALCGGAGGILVVYLRDGAAPPAAPRPAAEPAAPLKSMVPKPTVGRFLRCGRLWLIFASQTMLTPIIDSIGNLVPLFFAQGVGLSAGMAGQASAIFPFGAVLSILTVGKVFHGLRPKTRTIVVAGLISSSVASFAVLSRRTHTALTSAVALFTAMFGIALPCYIINVPFIMRVAGPFSGTLSGVMDAPGNLASIAFMAAYPRLLAAGGWGAIFRVCQCMTAAGLVLMTSFLWLESRHPLTPLA